MIKHNAPSSVLTPFNPVLTLAPEVRREVNERFIKPILAAFFEEKGGVENYEALDPDKLITEFEFNHEAEGYSFVKDYLYAEVMQQIEKRSDGRVEFKPRYVVTFDFSLTTAKSRAEYPYNDIGEDIGRRSPIRYGTMKLGEAPVLYFIKLQLQPLIRFIRKLEVSTQPKPSAQHSLPSRPLPKIEETDQQRRNRQIDEVIRVKEAEGSNAPQIKEEIQSLRELKSQPIKGKTGTLRINLTWQTTDDLDLHVHTPGGNISYQNKTVEYQGAIGELDVDMNAGGTLTSTPQENINWDGLPDGEYKVKVHLYSNREGKALIPFILSIIPGDVDQMGDGRTFTGAVHNDHKIREVTTFKVVNGKLMLT